ncbi:efflux RND transporter periplasmic adaptor subunit [Thalassotalea euphylliae]|uniref:Efflux RND transporter periplasmic adaptor subunit n=1 Tax=Thalassotalea euphylliae TaxID=1655234 RepID=A0A3E0TV10_9GAMM|nr:efflux RND transporter periplasmic adaptor subunit [Thalassotalea euphylliae]REL28207.1 efflux RND transporter periplasmic adaptor subunit [Thalassotalea euphylliae]
MKKFPISVLVAFIGAASIFAAVSFNQVQSTGGPNRQPPKAQVKVPEVAVVRAQLQQVQASIKGYGEVQAHYRLNLTAQVSGKVNHLADHFATGQLFNEGDVLVTLDQQPYLQALADAKLTLANAELALIQEQRNSNQALAEWQRSGLAESESASDLVLRKPQLKAMQAQVESARRAVNKAKYDLAQTEIRAPFNGVIVSRDVQPGSYLQMGAQVASIYSTDLAEVRVLLSEQQWQNLPTREQGLGLAAELSSPNSAQRWPAKVTRAEAHLDSDSRQRAIIVSVSKPLAQATPLHDGTFVDVEIQGKALDQVWQLPASALTQQGNIWYVDGNQELQHFVPQIQFSQGNAIYIAPFAENTELNIVAKPLSSYLPGMKMSAKVNTQVSVQAKTQVKTSAEVAL